MDGNADQKGFSRLSLRSRIMRIVALVTACTGAAVSFFFFAKYAVLMFVVCGVFCVLLTGFSIAVLFRKSEKHDPLISFFTVVAIVLAVLLTIQLPWKISSGSTRAYQKNMKYLSEKHFTTMLFPEELPESAEKYSMEFHPDTFGQKSSLCVSYNCSRDVLDSYENEAQKTSVISPLTLDEAKAEDIDEKIESQIAEGFGVNTEEMVFQLKFAFPKDIDKHRNARIYIVSCEYDKTRPQTEAVMIDTDTGWVCFSKLF